MSALLKIIFTAQEVASAIYNMTQSVGCCLVVGCLHTSTLKYFKIALTRKESFQKSGLESCGFFCSLGTTLNIP